MKAETVAKYFLQKDYDNSLFKDDSVNVNGVTFSEGNARLNKYLHIAQNLFVAKNDKLLFEDNVYAFDNGGVVNNVRISYRRIKATKDVITENIPADVKVFLDKVYKFLENATLDDLIQISHEDGEWVKRQPFRSMLEQRMDILSNSAIYKKQYADALYVMDKLC